MKIRTKIILFFLAISIVLGTIGFYSVQFLAERIMVNLIGNYNALLARSYIESIDRIIYRRLESWELYINSNPDLTQVLVASNQEFAGLNNVNEYINTQDQAWQKSANPEVVNFIQTIIDNPISTNLRAEAKLYENKYGYNIFPEVFITNRYGVNIAQTVKTSDYNQADEDWWQEAKDKKYFVSDMVFDESSGIKALELGIRIDDSAGNFLGIAKVVYNIKDIFSVIDELVAKDDALSIGSEINISRQTITAYLMRDNGQIIYFTNGGLTDFVDQSNLLAHFKTGQSQHQPYIITSVNGVEKLFSHYHGQSYRDFAGLDWTLIVSKDTKEALVRLNEIKQGIASIAIIAITFFIIIISLFANSLTRPIRKLKEGVEIITSGNLDYRVGIRGQDEISQFSQAFDQMTTAIKQSRAEIDQKVEEQTKEIIENQKDLRDQQRAVLNILEDVEAEKEKVSQERDKIDTILHSIGDGVFVVDRELKITIFNQVAADISGYNINEAVGKPYDQVLKFVFEKDGTINNRFIKDAIATGKNQEMTNHTLLIRKDQRKVAVADSSAPLKDKSGQVIGCVVVFRDVTKEREVDKMKTEFVSLASHQLRTPLSAIKWFLEMVLNGDAGKINAEQKEYLQQAFDSNERMVRLVNDLLNVSRLEMGRLAVLPEPTNLVTLCQTLINELTPLFKAHNLKFKFTKPANLPLVKLDPKLISQVVGNFLSNGIKYTPGGGTVELKLETVGKNIKLSVKDSGIGIPKDQQKKIFEKFFRADNVVAKDTEGTGLGLYVAQKVIDVSGGQIGFSSVENKGSTFWFTLPLTGSRLVKGEKSLENTLNFKK